MLSTRRSLLLATLALVLTTGIGATMSSCARMVAHLSGDQEVPPVETFATGEALFYYIEPPSVPVPDVVPPIEDPPVDDPRPGRPSPPVFSEEARIDYTLIAAGIEGVTQAHIHCGAADVNGPIVVFLFGLDPLGRTVSGIQAEGAILDADVMAVADSAECPGGVASLSDLAAKMKAGQAYVNVHTLANPAGEIRGQTRRAGRDLD